MEQDDLNGSDYNIGKAEPGLVHDGGRLSEDWSSAQFATLHSAARTDSLTDLVFTEELARGRWRPSAPALTARVRYGELVNTWRTAAAPRAGGGRPRRSSPVAVRTRNATDGTAPAGFTSGAPVRPLLQGALDSELEEFPRWHRAAGRTAATFC